MTVRITMPPGMSGAVMEDGTHYTGREGGILTVEDEHAPFIRQQVGGDAGLTGYGATRTFLATKAGRWCQSCRKLWNSWNFSCVKCGQDTIPESERPPAPPSRMPSACLVPIAPEPAAATTARGARD